MKNGNRFIFIFCITSGIIAVGFCILKSRGWPTTVLWTYRITSIKAEKNHVFRQFFTRNIPSTCPCKKCRLLRARMHLARHAYINTRQTLPSIILDFYGFRIIFIMSLLDLQHTNIKTVKILYTLLSQITKYLKYQLYLHNICLCYTVIL